MSLPIDPIQQDVTRPAVQLDTVEETLIIEIKPAQEKKDLCWTCKKKVGLLGIECRCQYIFCAKHRYPEKHGCTFDFRKAAKQKLEEENPVCIPKKIQRF